MSDFVILTDSSCDLPATLADSLGLVVAPLTFELEGKQYTNYLDWREIAPHAFYDRLRGTALAPTSAVNVAAFTELMEPILRSGRDILYIGFSSGLSAAYQNGEIAAADLREKYPQRVILTVDSLCASQGEGLLVWLTAHKKIDGASITECRDFAEATKLHIVHWFTVEDLKFLWRGGRVSKTAATVGTILDIKPVMHGQRRDQRADVAQMQPVMGVGGAPALLVPQTGHAQPGAHDTAFFGVLRRVAHAGDTQRVELFQHPRRVGAQGQQRGGQHIPRAAHGDRKSTRLNSMQHACRLAGVHPQP